MLHLQISFDLLKVINTLKASNPVKNKLEIQKFS